MGGGGCGCVLVRSGAMGVGGADARSPEQEQLARLMKRDRINEEAARARRWYTGSMVFPGVVMIAVVRRLVLKVVYSHVLVVPTNRICNYTCSTQTGRKNNKTVRVKVHYHTMHHCRSL